MAAALSVSAQAQTMNDATPEERRACEPDVMRICPNMTIPIPNVPAIVACLRENRADLSPPCERVMFPRGRQRR